MRIKKRKRLLIRLALTVSLGLIFMCVLSVSIRSPKIERDFYAMNDYCKLFYHYNFDFNWEKHSYGLWNSYTYNTSNFYSYTISPVGKGFVGPAIAIVKHNYKNFPEDIWSDFTARGMLYYPTSDYNDKKWDYNRVYTVSFDKAYTVTQLQEQFKFGKINWLWLDTYGNGKGNQTEYYIQDGNATNGAYGVLCKIKNNKNDLKADAQNFVDMINKYDSKASSKTEKKLYDIKRAIKTEGNIKAEDLRIIGCIFYPYNSQDEEMQNAAIFKVIK